LEGESRSGFSSNSLRIIFLNIEHCLQNRQNWWQVFNDRLSQNFHINPKKLVNYDVAYGDHFLPGYLWELLTDFFRQGSCSLTDQA